MLTIEFCGERHEVHPGTRFTIGREADLVVDDNQFLHRVFLALEHTGDWWVVSNVGSQLAATVSDGTGGLEAYLPPGASLPLVFGATAVTFTAGPTTYSLSLETTTPTFAPTVVSRDLPGDTTIGTMHLTPDQRLLILALAEPRLRGDGTALVNLPSSTEAAVRLGWTITKFNRKLDNVCQKLQQLGVRGLHGGPDRLASNRRARLVEYSVATRLVSRDDLVHLDAVVAGA
jgi:hypothetical protein